MTCIVGLTHDGRVWLGGDSAGADGHWNLTTCAAPKVFANGEFLIGGTTSFRMLQLLRYSLVPPKRHPDTDVLRFLVVDFVDAVRACLKAGGFAGKHDEVEIGGDFLVGYAGRLFRICADYQVTESSLGYDACGCGEGIARGAMYACDELPPAQRIVKALLAAEAHSAGVRGPMVVIDGAPA